jgi:hypothetical protein
MKYPCTTGSAAAAGGALWDSSALLSEDSVLGKALHTLTGYVSRPDGIEIVFYLTTLSGIWPLTRTVGRPVRYSAAAAFSEGSGSVPVHGCSAMSKSTPSGP